MQDLHASPIREILSVVSRPGMISFAGGLPAPETFPALAAAVPSSRLQYGASEGDDDLRELVALQLRDSGLACARDQILILSGSQQGIDLVAKLFVDRDTPVAVESPTYLAALQVFRFFGARFVDFPRNPGGKPALLYVLPTFQNPTGRCYSSAERAALARTCDAAGLTLFEDDPYRELYFEPCDRTPVAALLRRASWIHQGSFSKSFAPGLRLGYLAASADLIPYLTRLKQASDLHSNRLSQWLVLEQLRDPEHAGRLATLRAIYRAKRDSFAGLLTRHFSDLATWEVPGGGMFFWVRLQRAIDTRELLPAAIARGVAFMPGEPFYPHDAGACGRLRLNFSLATEREADTGLRILGEILRMARPREAA
jgi:DNA-binding transcriptional MocR family regulator